MLQIHINQYPLMQCIRTLKLKGKDTGEDEEAKNKERERERTERITKVRECRTKEEGRRKREEAGP